MFIPSKKNHKGINLIEVLVVLAILAIFLSMLIPAIQHVRFAAIQVQSQNNMKQIALATHSYAAANDNRLPFVWARNYGWFDSFFFAILPYIEQGNIYRAYRTEFGSNNGSAFPIKIFVNPSDPTKVFQGYTSYATNAILCTFHRTLTNGIPDGSSNTLLLAEHYMYNCGGHGYNWYTYAPSFSQSVSLANLSVMRQATFADQDMDDIFPDHPEAKSLTFQAAPKVSECNPRIAQTPNSSGMHVALVDGSVRKLAPGISPQTYWAAVTPDRGEVLGSDW